MPVDIILTPADGYTNSTPLTPLFLNWQSESPIVRNYITTAPVVPGIVNTDVQIKDVIGTAAATGFSEFRCLVTLNQFSLTPIQWATVKENGVALVNQNPKIIPITQNGNVSSLEIAFQNCNLLTPQTYTYTVRYMVQGKNASNVWSTIGLAYDVTISLYVSQYEAIVYSPNQMILNHFKNTTAPYVDIEISGYNWVIIAPNNYILSSPNNDVTITPNANGIYTAAANGSKIVRFSINETFFNTQAPSSFDGYLIILDSSYNWAGSITYVLNVHEENQFLTDPNQLFFETIFGNEDLEAQIVNVITNIPFTISYPYWLDVVDNANDTANNHTLSVIPIETNNLSPGEYVGEIELSYSNGIEEITYSISVTFNLIQLVAIPYATNEMNFTKDVKFLDFFSALSDVYFELIITATTFDFVTQSIQSKTVEVPFKIPLFENKQTQNIGLVIEKLLFELSNLAFTTHLYKAADVSFVINQKSYLDNSIIETISTNNYKFLSGLTPKNIIQNCAILDINTLPKRVTANSFAYINMMLTPGNKNLSIIKNETEIVDQFGILPQVDTYKEKLEFNLYGATKGDKFEFRVDLENNEYISKSFIVFPDADYSTMIIFEDEARMIQSFEFTGKFSLKDEFENISQTLYQNLVEVVKKQDYKKTVTFLINTGFITANDKRTIQSICESKRAWIYISDEEMIEIIPITKTLPIIEVDAELINYDLEFQINRKYNEESYSF